MLIGSSVKLISQILGVNFLTVEMDKTVIGTGKFYINH